MKKLLLILLTALLMLPMAMRAQGLADYQFSTGTDATKWITLTTDSSLITNTAGSTSATWGDSKASTVQNIGFDFTFAGTTYTQFSVNSDGNLRFGPTVTGTSNYSIPFSATNANNNNPKINMLACDGLISDSGHIYHEVVGTEPNRVCVVEFALSTYTATSRASILRWQVQLFEGSNDIQIVYAPTVPPILPAVARQPGMCVNAQEIILINADHTVNYYEAGVTLNNVTIGNWPDVNRYYLFTIPEDLCLRPSNLTASNITETTASITWTAGGTESSWDIYITDQNVAPDESTVPTATVTTPSYDASELLGSTKYYVFVRANCSSSSYSTWKSIDFTTACPDYMPIPYVQNFDSYSGTTGGSTANIGQACWSQINTGTSSTYAGYPNIYNSATYAQSGTNSLRFYTYLTAGTYGDQYAIMPPVDVMEHPINTLQVEFGANKYSTYSLTLIVGVMDDSATVASFVPVDTIVVPTTETANVYSTYIVSFEDYTGTGSRIAFLAKQPTTGYNAGCVDDIIVSLIPNCKKPMQVVTTAVSFDEVTVDWTAMGDESNWDVVVVPTGTSAELGAIETTSEHPYTIEFLEADTTYDVYVRANCGSEVSPWSNVVTFTTRCTPTSDIPFTENFDSYPAVTAAASGVIPTCWTRETNYTSNYPYIYASQHASGTGSLYFYATASYYSKAVSRALDISQYAGGSLSLTFKALKTSTTAGYGTLQVALATNPDDESTYTVLKSLTSADYDAASTWYEFNVILQNQYLEPVYLVFTAPAATSNYVCIDDIVLDEVPDCSAPRNVYVNNIHGVSAQVNWDAAYYGAESYSVEYTLAGEENWSTPQVVTGNSCILNDLDPMSAYEVRVSSNCASGTADPVTANFHTLCLISDDVTIGTGTGTSYYIPFYGAYQYSYSQQIYTASEMNSTEKDISTISFQYTGSPITRTVDIYLLNTSESTLASSWAPMTGAKLVYSGDVTMDAQIDADGWNTIVLDSIFHYDGFSNLLIAVNNRSTVSAGTSATSKTFKYTSATGKGRYVYGTSTVTAAYDPFNMTVAGTAYAYHNNIIFGSCNTTTTCAAPLMQLDSLTSYSVTISWVPGYQETSWQLEYKAVSDADWTSEGVVTTSTYTITGLTSNTDYSIRLFAVCDGEELSTPAMINLTTPCAAIIPPFTEDFTGWNTTPSNCWNRYTGLASSIFAGGTLTSATAGWLFTKNYVFPLGHPASNVFGTTCKNWLVTPSIDLNNMEDPELSFSLALTKYNTANPIDDPTSQQDDKFMVIISTDNGLTWSQSNATVWDNQGSSRVYNNISYQGEDVSISLVPYIGQTVKIAFYVESTVSGGDNDLHIYHVYVGERPVCARPQNITVDSTTESSISFSWMSNGDEIAWQYCYAPQDSVLNVQTAEWVMTYDTFAVISDLNPNTIYTLYVRSYCGISEQSEVQTYDARTACGRINIPFFEGFEDYATGTAAVMYCFSRSNDYSTTGNYPYVSTTAATGGKGLYFYATAGKYNLIAMPQFDANVQLNTLHLFLKMKSTSSGQKLLVGVMTDPEDISTFVTVDTLTVTNTSSWDLKEAFLTSYTGTGSYVAIKYAPSTSAGLYVDDIIIETNPTCPRPLQLTAESTAEDYVNLSWPAAGGDEWDLIYGPTGFDPATSESAVLVSNLTDTFYVATGLSSGIIYDFYIRNNCGGGDLSEWIFVPATAAPYAYAFGITGADTITACGLTITDDGGPNGDYSNNCNYALTINPSDPDSLVTISGTFAGESAVDYLSIYNGAEVNENNLIVKLYSTMYGGTSGSTIEFGPITSEAGSMTIFFHSDQSVVKSGFIAAVNCVAAPSCRKPYNVSLLSSEANNVTLEWETFSENYSGFNVAVSTEAVFDPDTCTMTFTTNTTQIQITGLQANNIYYAKVQTVCSASDESVWSDAYQFQTDCEALATLPITENFDAYTATTSGSVANLPVCWHQMNLGSTSSSYYGYPIMYNSTTYAYSGSNSLRFYCYTTGATTYGEQWAILRAIDTTVIPIQTLQLKLKARKYSTSYPFNLIVGVMSHYGDTATFVPVDTISPTSDTYSDFTVYFSNYPGGGKYIALKAERPSSSYNAGNVDNIEISLAPTCLPVQNLAVTNITSNSISINWTPSGEEDTWNVAYRMTGDEDWTTDQVQSTPNYLVDNLQANATYYFRVQADCGGEIVSTWSSVLNAKTDCLYLDSLPFTENFDNVPGTTSTTATVNNLPSCWNHLCGTYSSYAGYPIVYNGASYAASGSNSMRFYSYNGTSDYGDQYAILPGIDDAVFPINTLQLTFDARKYSTSYATFTLYVGVMTDASNAATFVPVDTILVTDMTYDTYTVYFSNYAGNGNRIAIMSPQYTSVSYNAGYVDNIVLEEIPSCPKPQDPTASNATTNSIDLSWTEAGTATSWNIEYGPAGFTQGQGTIVAATTNPYTITGLTASTNYDFYVQSDCGGGDLSSWSVKGTFATECDAIALPYTENFDNYSGVVTATTAPAGYPDITLPSCWSFLNMSSTTSTYPQAFLTSSSTYAASGNCLFFKSSSTTPLYSILPDFISEVNTLKLSFSYRNEGATTSNGTLYVGYMSNASDPSTFVAVDTMAQITTITNVSDITFAGAPAGAKIAFRYSGGTANNYYLSIDNVVVEVNPDVPTCNVPTNVAASNVTYNSASINWTAGGDETAWNLQYKKAADADWSSSIAVTARPYALNGLDAQTAYNVRVQANCGTDGTSEWSTVANFTTAATPAEPCDAPTGLTVSNITTTTALVTWTAGGDETAWNVQYKLSMASEWNNAPVSATSYTIGGLLPGSEYTVQVQAKCSETNLSGWVSTTFTTQGTGISNVELANSISIMPNPAESYIELTINSNVNVKEASIYNAFGQLIQKVALNDNHARIDVSGMAAGMYFVRIANDSTMATKKFIKK